MNYTTKMISTEAEDRFSGILYKAWKKQMKRDKGKLKKKNQDEGKIEEKRKEINKTWKKK